MLGKNLELSKETLFAIRQLDDFDLVMLLSEVHDHGWEAAAVFLAATPYSKAENSNG